jgi:hypothetical protein
MAIVLKFYGGSLDGLVTRSDSGNPVEAENARAWYAALDSGRSGRILDVLGETYVVLRFERRFVKAAVRAPTDGATRIFDDVVELEHSPPR